jgi:radical SAM superfamily enzyme YgiQ (UPF0313 family)
VNVLLVNPNRMKPAIAPIGPDYLADSLLAAGHETRLLDLCFSEDLATDISRAVRDFTPGAIGVTVRNTDDCYFSGQAFFLPEIQAIIGMLRRLSDAPIVLGGVGFSVAPEAVLEFCEADFGIAGEGERAFIALLSALDSRSNLSRVPNLLRRENGSIRRNPSVPVDLAGLPPRRRALPDNSLYFRKGGQAGFETKRGCPMRCVYCADPVSKGHTTRLLPPAAVVADLSALLAQGIDHFHTCDCEFNLPAEHARDVCRALIDAGLGDRIRWYAYCAPTPFDEEMAALFKRAGCAGIDFGADSGCDEMLRRLGRHFTADDLAETARVCRRHGIPFMYDLLLGGPGETRETVRQTIGFVRRLDADCVGLSMGLRVYDGTPVARQIRAEGDPASNPNLYGAKQDNPHFLKPVFYISPALGTDLPAYVRELVAGDPRFFLPEDGGENRNYNYNDNSVLVRAIERGARGAYWDILRRLREPSS